LLLRKTPLRRSSLVNVARDARVVLLARLIDHAPLFPPAAMTVGDALDEDRRASASRDAFALARFVCPASRLPELPATDRELSVVLDIDLDPKESFAAVETIFREDLAALSGLAAETYVEVPVDADLEHRLDEIATLGFGAKIRCGGTSVPSVEELARFVRGCGERRLPFKATAGLHHAVRRNGDHGLLNLLAAVVFDDVEGALAEEDAAAFALDRAGLRWHDRVAGPVELGRARQERLRSIGSCSFFEPIEELAGIGALPL
jgi:hypothetical protein